MTAQAKTEDILLNQLYLAKFGNVDMEYSDQLKLTDLKVLTEQVEKWEKDLSKGRVKLEESKLKCLFKGLQKILRFW